MSISGRIHEARIKKGISINALSKVVGVTSTGAWHWDRGDTTPRPETLPKIASALDVSVEWLRGECEDSSPKEVSETLDSILADGRSRIASLLGIHPDRINLEMTLNPI